MPNSSNDLTGQSAMAPPSIEDQVAFQRAFRDLVLMQQDVWPAGELDYANAILESLERYAKTQPGR
jgi:hypothetical protein